MTTYKEAKTELAQRPDTHLLWDMLSMCLDGYSANAKSHDRVSNTLDRHVFKTVSVLYQQLVERLLKGVDQLPEDTGTMNPEPGYISIAYLSALNASDKFLSARVMSVNCQVIKRVGRLVKKLNNRVFANGIIDYLARIQVVLDNTESRRKAAKLIR